MTEPPRTLQERLEQIRTWCSDPMSQDEIGYDYARELLTALDAQSQLLAEANAKIEGWKEVYNQADKSRDDALDRLSATLSLLAEAREALSDLLAVCPAGGPMQRARAVHAKLKAASGEG